MIDARQIGPIYLTDTGRTCWTCIRGTCILPSVNDTTASASLAERWGRTIETKRREQQMSQWELADLAHTSQQTISRIERGAQGVTDTLKVRIAKAFGMSAGDLFTYDEVPA